MLDSEDSAAISNIYSDILTEVRETAFRVVCNQATMDDFDAMVENDEAQGIDEVLAAYTRAYNKFYGLD